MLDRHYQLALGRGPEHVSVEVNEQRAPTDESVRLLKEMEEAALKRVVRNVELRDNIFANAVLLQPALASRDMEFVVAFQLNGEDHLVRTTIPMPMQYNKESLIRVIIENFSAAVTEELLKDVGREIGRLP